MNVALAFPKILMGESSLALQLLSKSCSCFDSEKNDVKEEKGVNNSHSYLGDVTEYGFFFISMVYQSLAQMYYISIKICLEKL